MLHLDEYYPIWHIELASMEKGERERDRRTVLHEFVEHAEIIVVNGDISAH